MNPKKDEYMRGYGDGFKDGMASGVKAGMLEAARLVDIDASEAEKGNVTLMPSYLRTLSSGLRSRVEQGIYDPADIRWSADWERIAFNLCSEFGSDFVADKQTFAKAVVREYLRSLRPTDHTQLIERLRGPVFGTPTALQAADALEASLANDRS